MLLHFLFCFLSWHCMVYAWSLQLCLLDTESNPTWLLNDECHPPGSLHSTLTSTLTFFFPFFFVELFVFVESTCFFQSFIFSFFLFCLCHGRHQVKFTFFWAVVMRWPTVPCLCFRGSTTYRHPNLEGEQVGQQTTALHQSLWRLRWAEGSFVKVLRFGAHLAYFFSLGEVRISKKKVFHRSWDNRNSLKCPKTYQNISLNIIFLQM